MSTPTAEITCDARALLPFAPQSIFASKLPVESVGCILGPSSDTGHGPALGVGPVPCSDSSPTKPVVFSPPPLPPSPPWWLGTTNHCAAPWCPATAASRAVVLVIYDRRS